MVRATDLFVRKPRNSQQEPSPSTDSQSRAQLMSGEVLLLVGDEATITQLQQHLSAVGFVVTTTRSESEVLAYARTRQPALVICDMATHQREGLHVLGRLRSSPRTEQIPFVFLCERGQLPDKIAGREIGASDYVTKPVSPPELISRIRAILYSRRGKKASAIAPVGEVPAVDITAPPPHWLGPVASRTGIRTSGEAVSPSQPLSVSSAVPLQVSESVHPPVAKPSSPSSVVAPGKTEKVTMVEPEAAPAQTSTPPQEKPSALPHASPRESAPSRPPESVMPAWVTQTPRTTPIQTTPPKPPSSLPWSQAGAIPTAAELKARALAAKAKATSEAPVSRPFSDAQRTIVAPPWPSLPGITPPAAPSASQAVARDEQKTIASGRTALHVAQQQSAISTSPSPSAQSTFASRSIGQKEISGISQSPSAAPEQARNLSAAASTPAEEKARPTAGNVEEDLFEKAFRYTKWQIELCRQRKPLDIGACAALAEEMENSLRAQNTLLLMAVRQGEGYELARHMVNVAVFAIKIGHGLGYSHEELVRLGMVGLLHDIGMALIPESILNKKGSLTQNEFELIKKHPEKSRDIIAAVGPEHQWLANIVYQEHEREQGQGYPRGLRGEQIHEFAKVIGVADLYESFTHPRTFRKTFVGYEALQKVIEMRGEYFPARIIKAFMTEISVFPLGSYVLLSTGEIGQVIRTNPDHLLRPVVAILYDAHGIRKEKPIELDLKSAPLIYISKPMTDDELPR